jgi:hypothetical protein
LDVVLGWLLNAFRIRAITLKTHSAGLLALIDRALATTKGVGGVAAVRKALKNMRHTAGDRNLNGEHALAEMLRTIHRAAGELADILDDAGPGR